MSETMVLLLCTNNEIYPAIILHIPIEPASGMNAVLLSNI